MTINQIIKESNENPLSNLSLNQNLIKILSKIALSKDTLTLEKTIDILKQYQDDITKNIDSIIDKFQKENAKRVSEIEDELDDADGDLEQIKMLDKKIEEYENWVQQNVLYNPEKFGTKGLRNLPTSLQKIYNKNFMNKLLTSTLMAYNYIKQVLNPLPDEPSTEEQIYSYIKIYGKDKNIDEKKIQEKIKDFQKKLIELEEKIAIYKSSYIELIDEYVVIVLNTSNDIDKAIRNQPFFIKKAINIFNLEEIEYNDNKLIELKNGIENLMIESATGKALLHLLPMLKIKIENMLESLKIIFRNIDTFEELLTNPEFVNSDLINKIQINKNKLFENKKQIYIKLNNEIKQVLNEKNIIDIINNYSQFNKTKINKTKMLFKLKENNLNKSNDITNIDDINKFLKKLNDTIIKIKEYYNKINGGKSSNEKFIYFGDLNSKINKLLEREKENLEKENFKLKKKTDKDTSAAVQGTDKSSSYEIKKDYGVRTTFKEDTFEKLAKTLLAMIYGEYNNYKADKAYKEINLKTILIHLYKHGRLHTIFNNNLDFIRDELGYKNYTPLMDYEGIDELINHDLKRINNAWASKFSKSKYEKIISMSKKSGFTKRDLYGGKKSAGVLKTIISAFKHFKQSIFSGAVSLEDLFKKMVKKITVSPLKIEQEDYIEKIKNEIKIKYKKEFDKNPNLRKEILRILPNPQEEKEFIPKNKKELEEYLEKENLENPEVKHLSSIVSGLQAYGYKINDKQKEKIETILNNELENIDKEDIDNINSKNYLAYKHIYNLGNEISTNDKFLKFKEKYEEAIEKSKEEDYKIRTGELDEE